LNGAASGFLLTPISEPTSVPESSSAMGILAFSAIGATALPRRKKAR